MRSWSAEIENWASQTPVIVLVGYEMNALGI